MTNTTRIDHRFMPSFADPHSILEAIHPKNPQTMISSRKPGNLQTDKHIVDQSLNGVFFFFIDTAKEFIYT
ncbi:MAG: hypothetical protein CMM01_19295 [Rhodopirellula sp.]|nr:hypothetical protein [Rhodopirellula sp.]OUX49777.1 MAG: hypothetical protein CBE43_09230 [Rhodopirellula sp. TMED283]